jgi:hypothetical protein
MEFVDFMGCTLICSVNYRDFVNYYRPHILNIYRLCGYTIVVDGMFGLLATHIMCQWTIHSQCNWMLHQIDSRPWMQFKLTSANLKGSLGIVINCLKLDVQH